MTEEKDWKKKYFDSLQQLEDEESIWAELEILLRKAISRLSITAKGHDKRLDQILQNIQKQSREKNDGALQTELEALSNALSKMDEITPESTPDQADKNISVHDHIHSLTRQLHFDSGLQEKLEKFKTSIDSMDNEQCVNELARLVNLNIDPEAPEISIQQVLLTLIEKIMFTHGDSNQLTSIKDSLHSHFETDNWRQYLDQIIGEIRVIIQNINDERIELEGLIIDVTRQLNEISGVLSDEHSANVEGRKETKQLQLIMNKSVENIQASVSDINDIESLKSNINDNLYSIKNGVKDFIEKDEKRYKNSEQRNDQLQKQIRAMEQESDHLKEKLTESKKKLMFDSLTGARSRLSYDEILDQEIKRWSRYQEVFSFALFDIDHFKQVNDQFGHNAGDKALRIVANMMSKKIRKTDFLFRIGGEEFVLLLPKTELANAAPLVEKIRVCVSTCGFHFKKEKVEITMSVGLTVIVASDNAERIYERADKALYQAKSEGRDRLIIETG